MDRSGTYSQSKGTPNMTALHYGSAYLWESAISHRKIIKSKYRSTMTDDHIEVCNDKKKWQLYRAVWDNAVMQGTPTYIVYEELSMYLWINKRFAIL